MSVKVLTVPNVNYALTEALWWLRVAGREETSRAGKVLAAPDPVVITYMRPTERVLFSAARDANPFFHLFEALWMLAGRNDVGWIQQFNSRMGEFSDDKTSLWGAYGWRWRQFFLHDQLLQIIYHLHRYPNSRRAVLSMWSPNGDLWAMRSDNMDGQGGPESRDVPCNTHGYLAIRDGRLNLTICNRSNDAIWGAFGTNAVHMSLLLEYLAAHLRVEVGSYHQITNNLHVYVDRYGPTMVERMAARTDDRYRLPDVRPQPIRQDGETMEEWDRDLRQFMELADPTRSTTEDRRFSFYTAFFSETVVPMYRAWQERRLGQTDGIEAASHIKSRDWAIACTEWLMRREKQKEAQQ